MLPWLAAKISNSHSNPVFAMISLIVYQFMHALKVFISVIVEPYRRTVIGKLVENKSLLYRPVYKFTRCLFDFFKQHQKIINHENDVQYSVTATINYKMASFFF